LAALRPETLDMNKQLPDNGAIEALNASILTSWTVILAHELGVFRLLLKEPRTREQLSSSLGIADRSLFPLLAVCCALQGEIFAVTPHAFIA
jgi:hypothetical protein